jgi:hypothetical protein
MPNDHQPRQHAMSLPEIVAGIERRVAAARVRTRPFPHVVVDDVLPQPVRQAIDRFWPGEDRLYLSNHFLRGEVRVAQLAGATEGRERDFWNAVRFITARTGRAIRAKLDRHLHDKFRPLLGPDWRRVLGDVTYHDRDAMLANYTGKLDMEPHIDHAMVAINGFVYLDDPDQPTPEPRRGTMLYRSLGFAWPSNIPIPGKLQQRFLREAGEVTWRDNRLLAYVNGPWSFHGVPKQDLGEGRRRLLMFGSLLDKATTERIYDEALR